MASSISRCDASGSCQPVMRPSTARTPRSGVITSRVQPSAAPTVPSGAATDSSARTTVVPTAITRPRAALTACGGLRRDPVALGVGRLAALERGHAGVEDQRGDLDAAGAQRR